LPQTASLMDAVLTFRRTGIRHLPVVDGRRMVGIVSERDVQRLAPSLLTEISQEEYNAVLQETILGDVMVRDPLTVTPQTELREAAVLLMERKVGCLPVIEDGGLVGIITVIDMLGVLLSFLEKRSEVIAPAREA